MSIKLWSWESSNGVASDIQTVRAYEAITNHGPVSDFAYEVWNDLVDKINEAQGHWINDVVGGLTYDDTKMSITDRTLTANRFNSMKYNVDSNKFTGVEDVKPGDQVIGHDFIKITNALNDWINSLQ